ncbi:MAG: hypothetical protein RL481_511 [Pseudomonadota bacterium]
MLRGACGQNGPQATGCPLSKPCILINASLGSSLVNFRGPLILELVRRGYRVVATAPDIGEQDEQAIKRLGAEPVRIDIDRSGTSIVADLRYGLQLFRLIRALRPAFVLGYTIKPNIWGSLAARVAAVPSAAMVTGLGFTFIAGKGLKRRATQWIAKSLYRLALASSHSVIFQNPDDIADFVAAGCLKDASKARLVNGSGVDLAHFQSTPLPDQPVFLLIARLLVTKGIREFVTAAATVRKALPEARFIIAGPRDASPDGINEAEIASWSAQAIEYVGELGDVRPAIAGASIYVLPSYREGTPRSVLEAMAMGRPIITTDAPGCRQTVADGVSGFLVPVYDTAELAKAMHILGGDAKLRRAMAQASLKRARELYAVEAVNETLLGHLGLPPVGQPPQKSLGSEGAAIVLEQHAK